MPPAGGGAIPKSPPPRSRRGGWKHSGPPPASQGWRGPVRGSGKWLAAALEIDYKTFKRRHAMGSLWVRPVDGKTLDVWTQSQEDDDKLLIAKKEWDAKKAKSQGGPPCPQSAVTTAVGVLSHEARNTTTGRYGT